MDITNNALFTPIKIGPRRVPNRFAIQPMEMNNAVSLEDAEHRGDPNERTYQRYRDLLKGGAGICVLEAISITDVSVARDHQLMITPRNAKALERFVADVKSVNKEPIFVCQLTHSGEISNPAFSKRVTPKPMPGFGGDVLSDEDAEGIIEQYVTAARIARDAGFDGLDLKFCHGYLGGQILRPYNDRKWKYGGPKENRFRFGYEVYERVSKAINDPNFILGSKVTMYEGVPGGQGCAGPRSAVLDLSEPLEFVRGIEERGAHFIIETAGGPAGNMPLVQPPQKAPDQAYLHFYFTNELKKAVKSSTAIVGSGYSVFSDGHAAFRYIEPEDSSLLAWGDRNIRDGVVDMVALGRQSIADALLPAKLLAGKWDEVSWCVACDGCLELLIRQKPVGCVRYDQEAAQMLAKARREFGRLDVART